MASDILLGFIIGLIILAFANPFRGIVWIMLEQRKQIAFLRGDRQPDQEFPNRKEES